MTAVEILRGTFLAACLLSAITLSAPAAPSPSTLGPAAGTLVSYPSTFVTNQTDDRFDDKIEGTRGYLFVPENRFNRHSRTIMLGFWLFKSTATHPRAPLIYLHGGPGHSNIEENWADVEAFKELRKSLEIADFILLDQRGAGSPSLTLPNLNCPNSFAGPLDSPWRTRDDFIALGRKNLTICAEYFARSGADLRGYNNEESARDIDDLRKALGYRKINIYGVSYGSYLARVYLEMFPQSVERAGIGGVIPQSYFPLTNPVLEAYAKADAGFVIDADHKVLAGTFLRDLTVLLRRLRAEPVVATVKRPDTGAEAKITLGAYDLQYMLAYNTRNATNEWPTMIASVKSMLNGDFSWLAQRAIVWRLGLHRSYMDGKLMGVLMSCNANIPEDFERLRVVDGDSPFGAEFGAGYMPEVCSALTPYLAREHWQWRRSSVPTLFWNGDADATTPLSAAKDMMAQFDNAQLLVLSGESHRGGSARVDKMFEQRFLAFFGGSPFQPGTTEILRGN